MGTAEGMAMLVGRTGEISWLANAFGALSILVGVVMIPRSVAASEPSFKLTWARGRGADSCAASDVVAQRVAQRLGRNPFTEDAPRKLEGVIEHVEDRWIARLHVRDRSGESLGIRELQSDADDCESIQAAAVLAIALAIDPDAELLPPASDLTPEPATEPAAIVDIPDEPAPVAASPDSPEVAAVEPQPVQPAIPDEPPPDSGTWTSLNTRGGVSAGLTPGTSGAAEMSWAAGSGPLAWTASALLVDESETQDGIFSFGLTAFGLGGCYMAGAGEQLSAGACASAWVGSTHAVVREVRPTDPGARLFTAASLGPVARAVIAPPFHIELSADLFIPLVRKSYTVTGWEEPAWKPPAAALTILGGVGVSFP
jgi:hypothetical protein